MRYRVFNPNSPDCIPNTSFQEICTRLYFFIQDASSSQQAEYYACGMRRHGGKVPAFDRAFSGGDPVIRDTYDGFGDIGSRDFTQSVHFTGAELQYLR